MPRLACSTLRKSAARNGFVNVCGVSAGACTRVSSDPLLPGTSSPHVGGSSPSRTMVSSPMTTHQKSQKRTISSAFSGAFFSRIQSLRETFTSKPWRWIPRPGQRLITIASAVRIEPP
jgi:hypothetical protein